MALLTARFAVQLGRMEVYRLVSRSKMAEVLEFQQFSLTCRSAECAIGAGQLLNVRYMLYGSMGRIGSMFMRNVYITCVEKGAIISTTTMDHSGSIESLLTEGMAHAVNSLLQAAMESE